MWYIMARQYQPVPLDLEAGEDEGFLLAKVRVLASWIHWKFVCPSLILCHFFQLLIGSHLWSGNQWLSKVGCDSVSVLIVGDSWCNITIVCCSVVVESDRSVSLGPQPSDSFFSRYW